VSLQIFGFHEYPHDFAVSRTASRWEDCHFLLDFSRPLIINRWFLVRNKLIGPALGLLVPVVHTGERSGGYVIGVTRGEEYFIDLPKLWKAHRRSKRQLVTEPVEGLQIIAAFGTHFPEDC